MIITIQDRYLDFYTLYFIDCIEFDRIKYNIDNNVSIIKFYRKNVFSILENIKSIFPYFRIYHVIICKKLCVHFQSFNFF